MKVGILTWHKAVNHGAVLQAYASQKILQGFGFESIILDYSRVVVSPSVFRRFFNAITKIKKGTLFDRKIIRDFDARKAELFFSFRNNYLKMGGDYSSELCDVIMIGSDMVFNLKQGYNPYMFGYGLITKKFFSYAACSGGTTYELVKKYKKEEEIANGLKNFSSLGYRDEQTLVFIKSLCDRSDLVYNIDPVLLYGFEKEKIAWTMEKWTQHKPYILIYSYHGYMENSEVNTIKRLAAELELDIISCGYYHTWCNESINASPNEFLEMFVNARYVITDTFHGTVFSLICEKEFVSIIRDNGYKLMDLLQRCGLTNRIATCSEDIKRILSTQTDYSYFRNWIKKERKCSEGYILEQITDR